MKMIGVLTFILSFVFQPFVLANFEANTQFRLSPSSGASAVNYYHILNVDAQASLTQIKEASHSLPKPFSREELVNLGKNLNLSPQQNQQVRYWFNAINQVSNNSLLKEFVSYNLGLSKDEQSKLKIRILTSHFTESNVAKVAQLQQEALRVLTNSALAGIDKAKGQDFRVRKDILANVLRKPGHLGVIINDPVTGKPQRVWLPVPSQSELAKFKLSEFIEQIKGPTIQYSVMTGSLLGLLHGMSYAKLATDYASNPTAVQNSYETYINPLYVTSIASFFMGAHLANKDLYQRNIMHAYQLLKEGRLLSDKPLALKQARAGVLANLSFWGLGTGLATSMVVLSGGEHLMKCLPLFNDRTIDERPISMKEKAKLNQLCDQAWHQYVLSYGDQFIQMWVALAAARHVVLFGTLSGQAAYQTAKGISQGGMRNGHLLKEFQTARSAHLQSLEIARKGTQVWNMRSVWSLVSRGSLQMAATIGVVWGLVAGYSEVKSAYTVHRPVTTTQEQLSKTLSQVLQSPESNIICQGELCGAELVQDQFKKYHQAIDTWRGQNLNPLFAAVDKWSDLYAQSLNEYRATRLLYSDLVYYIGQKRQTTKQLSNSWVQSFDPNPWFRSTPFFGVKIDASWDEKLDLSIRAKQGAGYISPQDNETLMAAQGQWIKSQATQFLNQSQANPLLYREINQFLKNPTLEVANQFVTNLRKLTQLEPMGCQLGKVQTGCLSTQLLQLISYPESEIWAGRSVNARFKAGYQNSHNVNYAFGSQSLPMGSFYMMQFEKNFLQHDIDAGWYPEYLMNRRLSSLSEYLVLASLCGSSVEQVVGHRRGYQIKFSAPRLPLKTKFDVCQWYRQRTQKSSDDIWHEIKDIQSGKVYAGIIDFLFQELDDSLMPAGAFQKWWDDKIKPQMVLILEEQNQSYQVDIINKHVPEVFYQSQMSSKLWSAIGAGQSIEKAYFPSVMEEWEWTKVNLIDPLFTLSQNQGLLKAEDQERIQIWLRDLIIEMDSLLRKKNINQMNSQEHQLKILFIFSKIRKSLGMSGSPVLNQMLGFVATSTKYYEELSQDAELTDSRRSKAFNKFNAFSKMLETFQVQQQELSNLSTAMNWKNRDQNLQLQMSYQFLNLSLTRLENLYSQLIRQSQALQQILEAQENL